jgi:hypothetical protein
MEANAKAFETGKRDARSYCEFHAFERVAVLRDGRKLAYIGQVSREYFAGLTAGGCKVR